MSKGELAAALAQRAGLTSAKASEVVSCIFDVRGGSGIIAQELASGGKVSILGFGSFGTKTRAARTGTNPATGEKIQIAQRQYAYFKAGKSLRDLISG